MLSVTKFFFWITYDMSSELLRQIIFPLGKSETWICGRTQDKDTTRQRLSEPKHMLCHTDDKDN